MIIFQYSNSDSYPFSNELGWAGPEGPDKAGLQLQKAMICDRKVSYSCIVSGILSMARKDRWLYIPIAYFMSVTCLETVILYICRRIKLLRRSLSASLQLKHHLLLWREPPSHTPPNTLIPVDVRTCDYELKNPYIEFPHGTHHALMHAATTEAAPKSQTLTGGMYPNFLHSYDVPKPRDYIVQHSSLRMVILMLVLW